MIQPNHLINLISEIGQSDLKRQIEFLKVENLILRQKCIHKRMHLNDSQKQLLIKYALPLGPQIKHLISIVHYSTYRNWVHNLGNPRTSSQRGRPRIITEQIRLLIVQMARHNKWGYTKILAEGKKLNVKYCSRTSVRNILNKYGISPFKIRSQDTWDQYLRRTFQTLWSCDYFCKSVWTPLGRKMYYVLFFININTRKVHIVGITPRVTKIWLMKQTKKLDIVFEKNSGKTVLIRDNDIKFYQEFDEYIQSKNITTMKIPPRSPNLNPYSESWVATVKRECLNHFIVLGKVPS